MELWSTAFLAAPPQDDLTCAVEQATWRRLQDEHDGTARLFAKIRLGEKSWICALGSPVICEMGHYEDGEEKEPKERIFLPYSMLAHLGTGGSGEEVTVEWLPPDAFPEATLIKIRPHDSAFYHVDAKEELEAHFTRIGIVQEGTTIMLPLAALGGFEVAFDIIKTEPANVVLAQGDEVAIDFDEALDAERGPERLAERAPECSPGSSPGKMQGAVQSFDEMIPVGFIEPVKAPGHVLGGTVKRMADGRPWNPWR
jgi:hypothetical protein